MTRLGIYVFCDKDGIVDDYIPYLLNNFIPNFQDFLIVSNNKLTEKGKRIFQSYTDHILICEDEIIFDIVGYKKGLEYFGWDTLKQYDEIVLTNDSLMGPIYPLHTMFSVMRKRTIDFWGLVRQYKNEDLSEYILFNFITFRNRLVQSKEFQNYWTQLTIPYMQKIKPCQFAIEFTTHFERMGFQWDTYIDTEDMKKRHYAPSSVFPLELISQKQCPFFKKEIFYQDYGWMIENTTGHTAINLYHFLQKFSDYPADMILQNLLRTQNLISLYRCFHWNYVLPSTQTLPHYSPEVLNKKKCGLIVHSYYSDLIDTMVSYVNHLPLTMDVYFFTDTERKADSINIHLQKINRKNSHIQLVPNRGRDIGSLLVGAREIIPQYDYIGFVHDKKTNYLKPATIGEGFFYKSMENMLCSTDYICNIIQIFEENPYLGILSPSKPLHGCFFQQVIGKEWGANYDNVLQLANELGLHIPISPTLPPIAPFGDFFWFRPRALKPLFSRKWDYKDFPAEPVGEDGTLLHAIERIYAFVAQEAGYFSGYISTSEYACVEYTSLDYYLGNSNHRVSYEWQKAQEYAENIATSYENSTCWKITYPIRWIVQLLKQLRRRNE